MAYDNGQIEGFYNKYLGRGFSDPGEGVGWMNDSNAEQNIANSGEAQAYKARQTQPQAQPQVQPSASPWSSATAAPVAAPAYNPANYAGLDQRDTFYKITGTQQGSSLTPAQLKAYEPQLKAAGFALMPSADGTVQKVRAPNGMVVDVIQGATSGQNTAQWLQPDAPGQPGAPGGSSSFSSSSGISGLPTGASGDLYNMLMARAKQGTAVDKNDPNIKQQVDPYTAQTERSRRNYLADVAEKANPLANLQGEERVSQERAGQANGLFESTLIGKELQSRRDEIAQALASMQGMLSQEQQLAMQRELAQLDANLRNRQISSGNDQFMANLGLQSENQNNYWDAVRSGRLG